MLLSKATYKGENSQAKSNKKHGVTINTTLHKNYKNDLERKKKCRNVTAVFTQLANAMLVQQFC